MSTTTANMGLAVPSVGDTDYPTSISSSLTAVDAHDHTSTKGVPIPAGGLASNSVITAKILDAAVTTPKIADLNVTTGKIAANAVTRAKLESVGQQISASSTAFSTTNVLPTDVTNLSVTITTTGRPVMIGLIPDFTGASKIQISRAATSATGTIFLLEGASIIAGWDISATAGGATNATISVPCGAIHFIHPVAAGTYTFKIQVITVSAATMSFDDVKLYAYEL